MSKKQKMWITLAVVFVIGLKWNDIRARIS